MEFVELFTISPGGVRTATATSTVGPRVAAVKADGGGLRTGAASWRLGVGVCSEVVRERLLGGPPIRDLGAGVEGSPAERALGGVGGRLSGRGGAESGPPRSKLCSSGGSGFRTTNSTCPRGFILDLSFSRPRSAGLSLSDRRAGAERGTGTGDGAGEGVCLESMFGVDRGDELWRFTGGRNKGADCGVAGLTEAA